ncbi:MAG: restriction endonuclease [bacterium]|nr:restriction endonuclease [bacterium]
MPIPDFQSFLLPVLHTCGDSAVHSMVQIRAQVAENFNLSDAETAELLPSGKQPIFVNRVAWAVVYLKKAELLESPARAQVKITQLGLDVLNRNLDRIDVKYLKQFDSFKNFREIKSQTLENSNENESDVLTPQETLESSYQDLKQQLAQELLDKLKEVEPSRFERIVIELLVQMGYGGSLKDAGKALGKAGDGGVDGIINEDRLGLDVIYIQAKKWDSTVVGRPEIQKFAGALQMNRARKGVFITTSTFSKEALDSVNQLYDSKMILIDGEKLVEYMIEFNLGVSTETVYEIKRIDSDYFSED